ncbi:hypothetical protein B0H19DRAFT_471010 [Mycena capillaripes]|nr:hypothetical protein B0H19DRAFT_471010 [Mycena capillaripes]
MLVSHVHMVYKPLLNFLSRGIFFRASIILFAWRLGQYDFSQDVPEASLGTRVFLMLVVVAGVVHLALAISQLRRVSNPVSAVGVDNSV